jgi:hypothetical protein
MTTPMHRRARRAGCFRARNPSQCPASWSTHVGKTVQDGIGLKSGPQQRGRRSLGMRAKNDRPSKLPAKSTDELF